MLLKVLCILDNSNPQSKKDLKEPDPSRPVILPRAFLHSETTSCALLLPSVFKKVVKIEKEALARPKASHQFISWLYSMDPEIAEKFSPPVAPVAVQSNIIISADFDGFLRDPCDMRINLTICKNFKASQAALWASSAGSLFNRGPLRPKHLVLCWSFDIYHQLCMGYYNSICKTYY